MRLNNFREPRPDDYQSSSPDVFRSARAHTGAEGELISDIPLENFQLEDIPSKMILVDQKVSEDTHLVIYH